MVSPHRPIAARSLAFAISTAVIASGICANAATAAPKKAKTTISGVVWADGDGDGVRDAGEATVAGARVVISRKAGSRFRTAKTVATSKKGAYKYTVQKGGTYQVLVNLPTGFSAYTQPNKGSDRLDSDVLTSGRSAALTLRVGGRSKRVDAGLRAAASAPTPLTGAAPPAAPAAPALPELLVPTTPPAPDPVPPTTPTPPTSVAVGNFVWSDTDRDGRQETGEPGLAGVRVELRSASGPLVAETTSATDGSFTLLAAPGTTYRLRVVLPAGRVFSPKNIGASDLDSDVFQTGASTSFSDFFTPSGPITDLDVGISDPGSSQLGNFTFFDANGNGIYESASETPLPGVTVNLWNESRSQIIASTVTSSVGVYALQAPRGVNYRLEFVRPAGYIASPKDAGSDDTVDSDIEQSGPNQYFTAPFLVGASTISTLDAGFVRPILLGNRVWDDNDADGIQDPGEPGLSGVIVQLWNSAKTQVIDDAVSSATGEYTLTAPGATSYRIRAVLPLRAAFSPKDAGTSDFLDSDINPTGAHLGFTDVLTYTPSFVSDVSNDIGIDLE
ncbi:MAG: hypothetical protein JHD16_12560 [Solirubrobacteraceae bacterium]|nr:hypothetical protein [Solirubrobacteraceae bacterium]